MNAALKRVARPTLQAVTASIAYQKERKAKKEEEGAEDEEEVVDKDAWILDRLRTMGPCPQGFAWFRQGNGWRCGGGSHFVYDDDPILTQDLDDFQP